MASGTCCGVDPAATPDVTLQWWGVSLVTLLATVLFSVYLQGKGFIGMLPILLGGIVGYIVAVLVGLRPLSGIFTSARFHSTPCNLPELRQPIDRHSSVRCRYHGYRDHP